MMTGRALPSLSATAVVTAQLGRAPRGKWWVETTCRFGFPQVIGTPPALRDGTPFPTLFWLTCPWLVASVGAAESGGATGVWASRLAADASISRRLRDSDERYRARRAREGGGADPCAPVGIAGQRDPAATKCLHAHVAAALAGIDDPIGVETLGGSGPDCAEGRCASLLGAVEDSR
ncbi:MAG TPA: DUF501 domain-containing protein [Coriobacteriia bacterium]|nr:DUF501 domain-containing protein [Coriobacteriia bacterium]